MPESRIVGRVNTSGKRSARRRWPAWNAGFSKGPRRPGKDWPSIWVMARPSGPRRSTLAVFSHHDPGRNREVYERHGAHGIGAAFRRGRVRLSPHLYNTEADSDRALAVLNAM